MSDPKRPNRPCPLQSYLQGLQQAEISDEASAFPNPKAEDLEPEWRQWLRLSHRLLDLPWVHPLQEVLLHELEESVLASWGSVYRRPFPTEVSQRREALADLARIWVEDKHQLHPEHVYLIQAEPMHDDKGTQEAPFWLIVSGEDLSPLPDQVIGLFHPEAPEGPMEGAVRIVGPVARLHAEEVPLWARLARLHGREWIAKSTSGPTVVRLKDGKVAG